MSDDPMLGQDCSGWVLERKIGQGGMGSVYLARGGDGARVVVKFLAEEQAQNPTWRGRFLREARVMEQVTHPNIVGVHKVVEADVPYIVMEFVDGAGLDDLLGRDGAFAPLDAARVARDVALGLALAHKNNLIHRDIKPANVLLGNDGAVKILDFGLAKTVAADDGLTLAGQALGTPHYMAPEQWGDHQVDARADVFALGATLYQLVTGALPFPGENPNEISALSKDAAYAWPRQYLPDLPEDLELVIVRALVPDRQFRYQDAQAIADDLQRVLDGAPVEVPCLIDPQGARHLLLPWSEFVVGSADECGVFLQEPSVAPQHAHLRRTLMGWIVSDMGSEGGTFVDNMKIVKDVLLKDGDQVRFGEVACVFRDGSQGARLSPNPEVRPRERVPAYLFDTLLRLSDRRCALALIEDLDRRQHHLKLEAARAELAARFGEETAAAAGAALEKAQRRHLARLPGTLFSMTHENLGEDLDGWLIFWEQAQDHFPPQAIASLPVGDAALRITKGEPEVRDVLLKADVPLFTIGRDAECSVVVANRSVSRLHATIQRLHRWLVVRDGASRFGTLLNGERVMLALLESGDTITLGKAELVFGGAPPVIFLPSDDPEEDMLWADPEVHQALESLKHPSTVMASLRFVELVRDQAFIAEAAASLFTTDADRARAADALTKILERRATETGKVLTAVLGPDPGDLWKAAYEAKCDDLPTQVVPLSWFGGPTA